MTEKSQEQIDFENSEFQPKQSRGDYCETGWDVPTSYAARHQEYDEDGYPIEGEDQS